MPWWMTLGGAVLLFRALAFPSQVSTILQFDRLRRIRPFLFASWAAGMSPEQEIRDTLPLLPDPRDPKMIERYDRQFLLGDPSTSSSSSSASSSSSGGSNAAVTSSSPNDQSQTQTQKLQQQQRQKRQRRPIGRQPSKPRPTPTKVAVPPAAAQPSHSASDTQDTSNKPQLITSSEAQKRLEQGDTFFPAVLDLTPFYKHHEQVQRTSRLTIGDEGLWARENFAVQDFLHPDDSRWMRNRKLGRLKRKVLKLHRARVSQHNTEVPRHPSIGIMQTFEWFWLLIHFSFPQILVSDSSVIALSVGRTLLRDDAPSTGCRSRRQSVSS